MVVTSLRSCVHGRPQGLVQAVLCHSGYREGNSQSFENRIKQHQLWIDEINAGEELAQARIDLLELQKDYISGVISDLSSKIARDEDISDEYIQGLVNNVPSDDNVVKAEEHYNYCVVLRKGFKDQFTKKKENVENDQATC